ncbi:MAG: phosphoribosyl-ATP diphosphatase [Gammaproteobacteria bacterium]|nr:phosphoribosyl-ATP diphosphatase [Gammaproteobacteria bacterium]NNC56243.1 phosphoribosyl-ATP diphosphatase [Woeseiaceae bacterium]
MSKPDIAFFSDLETIVQDRIKNPSDGSYTAKLAAAGTKRIAQKLGEEGVELALAATAGDREEVIDEAADLVYHLIVLLADQGLSLADIANRLELRHSGRNS